MEASTQTESGVCFDVTAADFEQRVLARSQEVPVLVDFWAEWCGPCRMLGPVLEQAVSKLGGRVLLAKVNTDHAQELAQRYRISGIPAVKAFHKGRVVSEFVGARDAKFVASFLASLCPSPSEEALEQAAKLMMARQLVEASVLLRPLCQESSGLSSEKLALAQVLLAEALLGQGPAGFAQVQLLLDSVDPRSLQQERVELLREVLAFFHVAEEVGGPAAALARHQQDPSDAVARYALASAQARRGEFAPALENLLELVVSHRRYREDAGRKAMLALFQFLGPTQEVTQEFRRRLQVVL
ncbi:MAG TPA: tetratricopeptide repeat protein [Pseudomonadota bacterium]|jgi:putative thioredoxin|nr:tetratricopeptide repeat protein [Deltaproteobacteria bacterium]HPH27046.1 tetratricopeptide repeat protein [Pseudomonadota bacterium]